MKINFLLLIACCLFLVSPVQAQQFSSPSYLINWGNFNLTSGNKNSASFNLTDTVGQNAPGYSTGGGLAVKSGFQYIYDTFEYLNFTVDKLSIDFGTLTPGIGVTDSNILTVTTPSGRGYQITAHEDHPLWINSQAFIPDTSCDQSDCTPELSTPWTQNDRYGFGFNAQGPASTQYFPSKNDYRPFANLYQNHTPALIASEANPVKNHQTLITYKVMVSPNQSAGDYQTYITYTLTPNY